MLLKINQFDEIKMRHEVHFYYDLKRIYHLGGPYNDVMDHIWQEMKKSRDYADLAKITCENYVFKS